MYFYNGIITGLFSHSPFIFKIRKFLLVLISLWLASLKYISSIFNFLFSLFSDVIFWKIVIPLEDISIVLTLNSIWIYSINCSTVFGPLIIILSQTVQFGGIAFTGPLISLSYSLSTCFICCAVIVMINLLITKFK